MSENKIPAEEMIDGVSGGKVTGNYPGCTCASCGGIMLDDHYELHGAKRSRCMNCGTTRWYT